MALIERLAREINPHRKIILNPDALLQRDIGFDSLGLAELILQTEREFEIRFPDNLISRIETPTDLLREISSASGMPIAETLTKATWRTTAITEDCPELETTLIGVLQWHVRRHPDRPHILLSDGYQESDIITYGDLARMAGQFASGLRAAGLEPGERIGIMLPTGREFFEAFFGALYAGAIPVPMYPPMRMSQLEEHLRRQLGILQNAEAAMLIIPTEGKRLSHLLGAQVESLRQVCTVPDLRDAQDYMDPVQKSESDVAMLQYTSGSTGDPKGVILTHANLLANVRAMGAAIDARSNDVFVSWLPLYHDLGLIGAWFGSMYFAVPVVVLSPLRFIVRPESWLWAIHRNAATLSAAPNFAFEFCASRVGEQAIDGLDLSSLRMVANGAEAISPDTIERFTRRYETYGFRPEAMTPVYGLAENSVGLAFSRADQAPIVDRVDRASLSGTGYAAAAKKDDQNPMCFVCCGQPLPGNEIRIVDQMGREVAERQQGRLEFRGPSATSGYYRQPEKTKSLFREGWLDSGDLAYIAGGNVFITGRIKDIIIKGGRNIYPEEIEQAVGNVAGVRRGCVAAFATSDPATGTEQLVVIAETRKTDAEEKAQLEKAVGQTVVDILDLPADRIVIAEPHAIPKTSSGKIRRSTTRDLYASGALGRTAHSLWWQIARLQTSAALSQVRSLLRALSGLFYAGWWWTVLILLSVVTWAGVMASPGRRPAWALVRSVARLAIKLMAIPVRAENREKLASQPHIIVVNHSSYFDSLVLAAFLPGEPVFVAKKELASQWVAGPFLRKLGVLFTDREMAEAGVKDTESIVSIARAGDTLVIFPEATFYRMPGLLQFRLGAFVTACATGLDVQPIVLKGTRSILRGEQWFPRRGPASISVLDTVAPTGRDFSDALAFRNLVREAMLVESGEPDMAGSSTIVQRQNANAPDR